MQEPSSRGNQIWSRERQIGGCHVGKSLWRSPPPRLSARVAFAAYGRCVGNRANADGKPAPRVARTEETGVSHFVQCTWVIAA